MFVGELAEAPGSRTQPPRINGERPILKTGRATGPRSLPQPAILKRFFRRPIERTGLPRYVHDEHTVNSLHIQRPQYISRVAEIREHHVGARYAQFLDAVQTGGDANRSRVRKFRTFDVERRVPDHHRVGGGE